MLAELGVRFLIGGAMVSLFALLGDVLEPKSFGGLFGAAPSVALASLALAVVGHGAGYAAVEARSMVVGAVALLLCAACISWSLHRWRPRTFVALLAGQGMWFAVAALGWAVFLRGR